MEPHGYPPNHVPRTTSKKMKRHSLQPHIFLQLEVSSPEGKPMDASKVGVLDSNWKDTTRATKGNEQFMAHVRVEHCDILAEEPKIRNEAPMAVTPPSMDYREASAASEHSESNEEECSSELEVVEAPGESNKQTLSPSPTSIMNTKAPGRHDHLLEPLPNELFSEQVPEVTDAYRKLKESLPPPPPPTAKTLDEDSISIGEDVVDVRTSSLDLFAMIEDEDSEDENKEGEQQETVTRRRKSKRSHLRQTHSIGAREDPKTKKDGSMTPSRGRRKSLGAESKKQSKSGNNKVSKRNSIDVVSDRKTEGKHKSIKPARRSSMAGAISSGSRRRRSELLVGREPIRPSSERGIDSEELDMPFCKSLSQSGKPRRKHGTPRSDRNKQALKSSSHHGAISTSSYHGTTVHSFSHGKMSGHSHHGTMSTNAPKNKVAQLASEKVEKTGTAKITSRHDHIQPVAAIHFAGTIVSPVSVQGKSRAVELPCDWKEMDSSPPINHIRL